MPTREFQSDAAGPDGALRTGGQPPAQASEVRALLEASRLEVLPLKSLEAAADAAPPGATLTITCSPHKGLDATLRAAETLTARGFRAVPHLAARMVRDQGHLDEILAAATRIGIGDAFVPGGDIKRPLGPYESSLDLLRAMDERGHPFEQLGIAAYPEGHWLLGDKALFEALHAKQSYATYAVTQMCFSAESLAEHVKQLDDEGVRLPVYAGVAGAVDRLKLATIGVKIGLGQSLRFLKHQHAGIGSLLGGGEYEPTDLIEETIGRLGGRSRLRGLHIYTFNQVGKTEAWRRDLLARTMA